MYKYKAGLDLETAGLFATVALLVGAGLQPVFGVWADHGHQRRFIIVGTALAALGMLYGTVGLQFGEGASEGFVYAQLFVVLFLAKLGQGLFHPAGVAAAGSLNGQRRATLVSAFVACGLIGFAFSQMLFAKVYDVLDGRTHWMLLPAGLVVLAAVVWLRPVQQRQREPVSFRQIGKALHSLRGPLIMLYFVQALLAFVHLGLFFLMPEFAAARGYPTWLIEGGGWFLFILGAVVLMVPVGHLADRIGRRTLMLANIALSMATFYVMVAVAMPPLLFGVVCFASGAFMNTVNPLAVSFGQHLAPRHASVISGVLMGLAWAAGSSGQWLMGALGKADAIGPVNALLILGAALVPALGLTMLLPADRPVEAVREVGVEGDVDSRLEEDVEPVGVAPLSTPSTTAN